MMTDLASTTPQSLGRDSMVGLRLARVDGFEPAIALGQDELPAYLRRFTMLFADDATMRRGGIGRVTRAVNAQGEAVALKQLILPTRDEFDDAVAHEALVAKFKAAFREEYECHRALSGLKGFPRLYGWGEVDGVPAIVMEWVEGETLARLRSRLAVDDAGRLSPLVAARLGRDLFDLLCRMSLVGEGGTVIVCGEDPHLVELAKSTGRHVLSYGFAESNDIVCVHPDVKGIQSDFIVRFEDGTEHAVEIKSNPGRHNMLNATAVLTVAHVLGLDIDAAAKALSSFEGVRRRFTHVGDIDGITVVDDYGHHPTEIKATLAAASSLGYKHVDVVFQPHRYSRLQALCDDFADAFANADKLLLIDVFSAGEMPIPGVTSKMLADTVRAKHPGKEVVYCSSRLELNQELEQMVGEGDLLLTMGAGDVTTVGPEFIEYLTAKKDA